MAHLHTYVMHASALLIAASKNGDWSLLFATPEAINQEFWTDSILTHASTIALLALDESHCIEDW